MNCYTTFKDTSPRNHCTKYQGQRVDDFLLRSYKPKIMFRDKCILVFSFTGMCHSSLIRTM